MQNSSNLAPGDDTINTSNNDLRALTSVWAALCVNYDGTNIKKTVARLLNMYKPEDGIHEYKRLLKTLFVLLDDFDKDYLKRLLSMISIPAGFEDDTVRQVFFDVTGFERIDGPIFYQNHPFLIHEQSNNEQCKEINKNIEHLEKDKYQLDSSAQISCNISTSENTAHQLSSNSQNSHDYSQLSSSNFNYEEYLANQYYINRQSDSFYLPTNMNIKKNWTVNETPVFFKNNYSMQSNFSCHNMLVKTIDNKYLRVPIAPCNLSNYRYTNNPYHNKGRSPPLKVQITSNTPFETSKNPPETQVSGALNTTECGEEMVKKNYSSEMEGSNDTLIIMKKPESKIKKNTNDTDSDGKIANSNNNNNNKKNNDDKNELIVPFKDSILNTLNINKNLKNCIDQLVNRFKRDEAAVNNDESQALKLENINTSSSRADTSSNSIKKIDYMNAIFLQNNKLRQSNLCNSNLNNNLCYQANSINELTAYKRQYYDALLNIQRAKIAVASSLVYSPIQNSPDYDPYYADYQQDTHQWLVQQTQQKKNLASSNYQRFYQPTEYLRLHNPPCSSTNMSQEVSSPIYRSPYFYDSSSSDVYRCSTSPETKTKVDMKNRNSEKISSKFKKKDIKYSHD